MTIVFILVYDDIAFGVVSERLKVQSWKGCVVKATESSNLSDSAISQQSPILRAFFFASGKLVANFYKKLLHFVSENEKSQPID